MKKTLPHNVEMEKATLGSVLIDPEGTADKIAFLKPDDFYIRKNTWIYEAILSLRSKRSAIDFVTLCNELEQANKLEQVGGAAYLTELLTEVPSSVHAESYAEEIAALAVRRTAIRIASDIAKKAYNGADFDQLVGDAVIELSGLSEKRAVLRHIREIAADHKEQVLEWAADPRPDGVRGVSTQMRELDVPMGGLMPATEVIVAARPTVGKTAVIARVGLNTARQGVKTAIIELEMNAGEIMRRITCGLSRIEHEKVRAGTLSQEEMDRYTKAIDYIATLPLYMSDVPSLTTGAIRAAVAGLRPRVIIVDHLSLIADKDDSEVRRLGKVSWGLKQLAKDLQATVVVACQLNRNSEYRSDKRPTLADLRSSGEIEQNADVVFGLYSDDAMRATNSLEVLGLKTRESKGNTIGTLYFNGATMLVCDPQNGNGG